MRFGSTISNRDWSVPFSSHILLSLRRTAVVILADGGSFHRPADACFYAEADSSVRQGRDIDEATACIWATKAPVEHPTLIIVSAAASLTLLPCLRAFRMV